MKNLRLITLLFISFCSVTYGQESLTFDKVIQVDSVSQLDLYKKAKSWFSETYKSANDVIQNSDEEEGLIIGRGSMSVTLSGMKYACYSGRLSYLIKVQTKDGRYKVELTGFKHTTKAGNSVACSLGIILDTDECPKTGMGKKTRDEAWTLVKEKCQTYSVNTIKSIENYIKSETESKEEGW